MKKKAEELEVRTIMQGLEEFATFMSFQGNSSGIRILSVETAHHSPYLPKKSKKADVVRLQTRAMSEAEQEPQSIKKSVTVNDRITH